MTRSTVALKLAFLLCPVLSLPAQAQSAITEQEAHAIAVDAYIYFYPLVTMDVTRKQLTNVEPGKGLGAPMNVLFNVPTFPTADMKHWSITLYDSDAFQVANSLNRFAVSSWMPFKYNSDGSLDLYFQNESPGKDKEANWLPAPKGPFNLTMRLYGPKSDALTGKWNPPPVMRAQSLPGLGGQ